MEKLQTDGTRLGNLKSINVSVVLVLGAQNCPEP